MGSRRRSPAEASRPAHEAQDESPCGHGWPGGRARRGHGMLLHPGDTADGISDECADGMWSHARHERDMAAPAELLRVLMSGPASGSAAVAHCQSMAVTKQSKRNSVDISDRTAYSP